MGLYQKDLAQMLEVVVSTVTNWERNRTTPMLWALPKIIEFLGYDPSFGDPNALGGKLLGFRKSRGVTQKELARLIGIDPTTLGRLERNRGRYLRPVIEKLYVFLRDSTLTMS
jgi:transcriptional regulator with XRE-family HTH domain